MLALLETAFCVALAGPMVFAPSADHEKFEDLQAFLTRTVTNYMFQEDPVPRAYANIDVEKVISEFGLWIEATSRQTKRFSLGAAGLFAVGAAMAGPGFLLAAAVVASGAGGGAAWFEGEKGWIAKKLDNKDFFKDFLDNAKEYRHCCQVRFFRGLFDKRPWQQIEYGPSGLGHHSCEGYVKAIESCRAVGQYQREDVLFTSDDPVAPALLAQPVIPTGEELLAFFNEAKTGQFDRFTSTLKRLPSGVPFDSLDIPEELWHFIHCAVFLGTKEDVVRLMALGASPLKRTLDDKTILDVAKMPGAFQGIAEEEQQEIYAWLNGIFTRATSYEAIYQNTGMTSEQITLRVLADLETEDVFSCAVLPPLDCTQRAELIKTYLIDKGFGEEHLKKVDPELKFEDENLTIQQAEQKIKDAGYDIQQVKLEELAHEFLDCAKYKRFDEALAMLQKNPFLAEMRPLDRWSGVMQLAYTGGPRSVAQEMLACYGSVEAVLMIETDLNLVKEEQKMEKEKSVRASRRSDRAAVLVPTSDTVSVESLLAVVKNFRLLAEAGDKVEPEGVRSLIERAMAAYDRELMSA
jgi:hypothetical protein